MDFKDLPTSLKKKLTAPVRVFRLIGLGDPARLRECMELGADPNCRNPRGRPAIVQTVRGPIVEAPMTRVLLDFGADPSLTDMYGMTAIDHARRRLARYAGKPRREPRRSPSLLPTGDIRLHRFEARWLDKMRDEHPESADEMELLYLEERRRVAERVFDTRGNLEKIEAMLAPLAKGG